MTQPADSGGSRVLRPAIATVRSTDQLQEVVEAYSQVDEFVFDVETTGDHRLDPLRNSVTWIGFATEGRADIIPMGHPNGELVELKRGLLTSGVRRLVEGQEIRKSDVSKAPSRVRKVFGTPPAQLWPGDVFAALQPVLFGDARKIGHNIKFDIRSVAKYYDGEIPPPPYGDTVVADFLLDDTNTKMMRLNHVVKRRIGYTMPKGVGKKIEDHTFQEVARYLHGDVKMTWLAWKAMAPMLDEANVAGIMRLEMDCLEALIPMEQFGVRYDTVAAETLREELQQEILEVTTDAYKAAGFQFNLASPQDKQRALFSPEGRNLKPRLFTDKTGQPSTSEDALKYYPKDPLVKALNRHAELAKLMGNYVTPYLGGEVSRQSAGKVRVEHVESFLVNSRVHTNFKQTGARTGRFSSTNPALQTIPNAQKSKLGKRIRSLFVADPGYVILAADFGQIEPRIIASLAGEETMIEAFRTGEDIYTTIADPLGIDRAGGKLIVLSMSYGVGTGTLAERLGITATRAQSLLDDFYRRFPAIERYKKEVIARAMRQRPTPFIRTLLGRRRFIPFLKSPKEGLRSQGRRQAFNAVIQGSGADIVKVAMVRAHRTIPDEVRMLLTVHDELVFQVPTLMVEETEAIVREAMTGIRLPQIKVPLTVDIGWGPSWAEAK